MSTDLDARLLSAHERDDRKALVALYSEAADRAQTVDARYFYLTNAYIFALETGHADTPALRDRLKAAGRES